MNQHPTAAVIQMCSKDDREYNLNLARNLMDDAVQHGAKILALPENFSYVGRGDKDKLAHREDRKDGPSLRFLRDFAKARKVWIIGGSVMVAIPGEEKVANVLFLVDDTGDVRASYDKIHLFDAELAKGEPYKESHIVRRGEEVVVSATPFGTIGLSICYDLRFPEMYGALTRKGAVIMAIPASFTMTTGKDHWELLVRARAVENFSYVLAPNQWGVHPGDRRTYGNSMIVEPWGAVLARCADADSFALAPIDLQRVAACRRQIPCLKHRVLCPPMEI